MTFAIVLINNEDIHKNNKNDYKIEANSNPDTMEATINNDIYNCEYKKENKNKDWNIII